MPLTPSDAELVAVAVDAKMNRVIGTLQSNLKDEQAALLGAIASHIGGTGAVDETKLANDLTTALGPAIAKSLGQKLSA